MDDLAAQRVRAPEARAGRPDVAGRIGILTIGMSNTRNESDAFVTLSRADALRSPAVRVVNGAEGGASADLIADPAEAAKRRTVARRCFSMAGPVFSPPLFRARGMSRLECDLIMPLR